MHPSHISNSIRKSIREMVDAVERAGTVEEQTDEMFKFTDAMMTLANRIDNSMK